MILLNQITLLNFLSHSDTVIDFKPDQNVLIDGKSGSGKSSIVEGLIWALYGKGRSDNKSLIKKGNKKATVTVILEDVDKKMFYKIERSITGSNKHKLEVMEVNHVDSAGFVPVKTTGVKGAQEYLEKEILHSSYSLFVNSIAYPQDNIDNFVRQTASKRKDIILEIINNAGYDDYLKRTKNELTINNTDARVNEARINDRLAEGGDTKEKEKLILKLGEDIALHVLNITEKEASISKLETVKEETAKILSQFDSKKLEVKKLEHEAFDLRDKRKDIVGDLQMIQIDVVVFDEKELISNKAKLSELNKQKDLFLDWTKKRTELISTTPVDPGYDTRIELLNKNIINLMDQGVEGCVKCGYKNAVLEAKHAQMVLSVTNDLKDAQRGSQELIQALLEHKGKLDSLGEEPEYDNDLIQEITDKILKLEALQKQELLNQKSAERKILLEKVLAEDDAKYKVNEEAFIILEKELKGVDKIQTEYENLHQSINELKSKISSHMTEKESISITLAVAQKELATIEKAKKELIKLRKAQKGLDENIESLELLKEALGPNGIKAIVIDYTIPQLEEKINDILSKLSDFRIRLDTQKSGLTKDTTLEGLFISIINDLGEELDFDNYSGGERLKIIVAISEALSEIQNIGFRILDELFVGLDEDSIESFAEIMIILQQRFKQMFCISHLRSIKDLFDHRLMVTKTNGNSLVTK